MQPNAMGDCGISWHTHDPGVVLSHLAVAIADGADCLSDMAILREQTELFGPVASRPTAWRAIQAVAAVELRAIPVAVGAARARVWTAAKLDLTAVTLDFDATLIDAYSEKQDAAPTYKRGFRFHPFAVWCDETNEPLAAMLRPGNAGANNTNDHLELLDQAIDALPAKYRAGHMIGDRAADVKVPMLVRADSAGATHGFVRAILEANADYTIGYIIDGRVRDALLLVQEEHWDQPVENDGQVRSGAYVTELTGLVDMAGWGRGCRLICRRERPHPGAQLSLFDMSDGWRHTAFITNTRNDTPVRLEVRDRGRARVEDRVRCWKAAGILNPPFEDYVRNQTWTAITLIASCLLAWTWVASGFARPRLRRRTGKLTSTSTKLGIKHRRSSHNRILFQKTPTSGV